MVGRSHLEPCPCQSDCSLSAPHARLLHIYMVCCHIDMVRRLQQGGCKTFEQCKNRRTR